MNPLLFDYLNLQLATNIFDFSEQLSDKQQQFVVWLVQKCFLNELQFLNDAASKTVGFDDLGKLQRAFQYLVNRTNSKFSNSFILNTNGAVVTILTPKLQMKVVQQVIKLLEDQTV